VSFTTGTEAYGRGVGRYSNALAQALCDAAGVADGDAALDVGCGPGALVAELARRLGAPRVAGVDPSAPFVAAARLLVPDADIREAAAEELPFGDASFDLVLSQLVVNFTSDPQRALAEMRRVGQRTVAACVWDYAGEMTMLRSLWDAALELDPNAPDEGAVMHYCSPAELAELWSAASLRDVVTGELVVHADYADFADYWSPFPAGIARRPVPIACRSTLSGARRCARPASGASARRRARSA